MNKILREGCSKRNIGFISNKNIKPRGSYKLCTHPHPAIKRSHSPTPTHTQPKRVTLPTLTHTQPRKGHTPPHPPIPSQKKFTNNHSQLKKVTSTHTQPKKFTPTHTQLKNGHTQPEKGHTHPNITERKNVTCLTHDICV